MGWKGRKPFRIPAQAQRGWAHRQRDMCGMQAAAHRWAETRCPHGANSYVSHVRKWHSGFRKRPLGRKRPVLPPAKAAGRVCVQ